jgi:hypothetical protein
MFGGGLTPVMWIEGGGMPRPDAGGIDPKHAHR